jgi:hypothetical protein
LFFLEDPAMSRHATGEDVDRMNRITEDVFHLRWGRPPEYGEELDEQDLALITDWLCRCCPLPYEAAHHYHRRIALLRLYTELGV